MISSTFHFLLFEGLMRLDPEGHPEPAQAESVSVSEDGKTYLFHLRDAKWSDGTPVEASDFEQSWKDILDPSFPAQNCQLFYPIKNAEKVKSGELPPEKLGVKALGSRLLQVDLEHPTPYFLELVSFCVFYPVNQKIDRSFPEWSYEANPRFVTNGPFKLNQWKHHSEILLEKNPHYWQSHLTKLEQIHISMISNEMTALQLYEQGKLDYIDTALSPLPLDSLPELLRKGVLKIRPAAASTVCFFNNQQFPFNNLHLRKAFSLAINRQEIVNHITFLGEKAAMNAIPPLLKETTTHFFKDGDIIGAKEHFNKALKELDDELPELIYSYSSSELNHKIAQLLQEQWLQVLGVKIKLEPNDNKMHLAKLAKRDFVMAQGVWFAQYADQMNILERFQSKQNVKNYCGWENATYRQLLENSRAEKNRDERFAILEKAEALLLNEMPIAPLFHGNTALLVKPYVENVLFYRFGQIDYKSIYINGH